MGHILTTVVVRMDVLLRGQKLRRHKRSQSHIDLGDDVYELRRWNRINVTNVLSSTGNSSQRL
jgi:hypothetical protein